MLWKSCISHASKTICVCFPIRLSDSLELRELKGMAGKQITTYKYELGRINVFPAIEIRLHCFSKHIFQKWFLNVLFYILRF